MHGEACGMVDFAVLLEAGRWCPPGMRRRCVAARGVNPRCPKLVKTVVKCWVGAAECFKVLGKCWPLSWITVNYKMWSSGKMTRLSPPSRIVTPLIHLRIDYGVGANPTASADDASLADASVDDTFCC